MKRADDMGISQFEITTRTPKTFTAYSLYTYVVKLIEMFASISIYDGVERHSR